MRNSDLTRDQIASRIRELGDWFHNMNLGGVQTAPDHFLGDYPRTKWERFSHVVPASLRGMSVLDIGCNAGFYAIEMKKRGADRVLGVDTDESYLAQARFAAQMHGVNVELRRMSVYEVGLLREKFDLVIFMGVLYHLRHPLLALDLLHRHVVRDTLLFQSILRGNPEVLPIADDYPMDEHAVFDLTGYPKLHFVERRYAGDGTNWWIPNRACVEAMLRSAGFAIVGTPEEEVYVCRPQSRAAASDVAAP
jgi:tRNA (mo5U34)-methyltransferase